MQHPAAHHPLLLNPAEGCAWTFCTNIKNCLSSLKHTQKNEVIPQSVKGHLFLGGIIYLNKENSFKKCPHKYQKQKLGNM